MKNTSYFIVRTPRWIMFNCSHCMCEHRIDYDDFECYFDDEHSLWIASNCPIWECEDCEKAFSFDEVDYD